MKYCISIFMILVILSTQFSELMVYISFKMNQDYITKNLCVEKDVKDSTCMGCCQLEKRINNQQESKKELPAPQIFKYDFAFYITSEDFSHYADTALILEKGHFQLYKYTLEHRVFRPPQFNS